jgi:murein DD-endopeptidase MepM/ murein hydrolase activator NlpD
MVKCNRGPAGGETVRSSCAILLLLAVGACTQYQPVEFDGRGTWAEARAEAMARAEQVVEHRPQSVPDDVRRLVTDGPARGDGASRHRVAAGETLSGIAARYGVPLATLAKLSNIAPTAKVRAGQALTLPRTAPARSTAVAAARPPAAPATPKPAPVGAPAAAPIIASGELPAPAGSEQRVAAAVRKLSPATPAPTAVALSPTAEPPRLEAAALESPRPMSHEQVEAARAAAHKTPPALSGDGFLWPVRGPIASAFGEKPNGARNNGVNIKAAAGTPVLAAENGVVVYAGDEIPGYGNMLLVSHAQGFTTAYAHNHDLLVRVGDVVARGDRIATVGSTGGVGNPQLHFELREGKKPIDPMAYLDTARTRMASSR